MRTRVLLASLGLAAVVVLGAASPSFAAGEEGEHKFANHDAEECFEKLEAGKTVTDCQEAPSPILPPTNELVWGTISFVAVFVLLRKMAWPGIKKGMEGRTERIAADLEAAESKKTEADTVLAEYRAQLADAKNESGRIIEEARQAADGVRQTLQAKAEADIAELRTKAVADIEGAKSQAIADLRGEVTALALGAAEQVVGRNLDEATNAALIEAYIDQVGASR